MTTAGRGALRFARADVNGKSVSVTAAVLSDGDTSQRAVEGGWQVQPKASA
jgi:hypothetical protein